MENPRKYTLNLVSVLVLFSPALALVCYVRRFRSTNKLW